MSPYAKRSFLKLLGYIDVAALFFDYQSIPAAAWTGTYWDAHGSTDFLMLRGGQSGREDAFTAPAPTDRAILQTLPYIAGLLADAGPFGRATYAFLARMKPMGVVR